MKAQTSLYIGTLSLYIELECVSYNMYNYTTQKGKGVLFKVGSQQSLKTYFQLDPWQVSLSPQSRLVLLKHQGLVAQYTDGRRFDPNTGNILSWRLVMK